MSLKKVLLGLGGIGFFSLFLFSCSSTDSSNSRLTLSGPQTSRGSQNQLVIKVSAGKSASSSSQASLEADLSLFEEQGFQTAKDRFLQMDLIRRYSQGRLAELIGEQASARDLEAIAVGLPLAIERSVKRVEEKHPETYLILKAYAKGVNRYLREVVERSPVDEILLKYRTAITLDPNYVPAEWTPADSLSIGTALTFFLSSNLQEKASLGVIAEIFFATERPDDFFKFLDLRPLENAFIIGKAKEGSRALSNEKADKLRKSFRERSPSLWRQLFRSGAAIHPAFKCKEIGYPFPSCQKPLGLGSNNWVVSKEFAGGEETLLSNDPHLMLTYPMTFHEVALDSKSAGGTIRVRGFVPPGIPGVLIGMNDSIAWGFTNLGADVDDVYLEELNENRTHYYINGKQHPLTIINHDHYVRGRDHVTVTNQPIKLRVAESADDLDKHGPIFSEHREDLKKLVKYLEESGIQGKYLGISYKWVGHQGTTEAAAILNLNRASNFDEFKSALSNFQVGAQNVVYADRQGNIGYYAHGLFPVRKYVTEEQYPPYMFVLHDATAKREWESEYRKVVPELFKNDGFIVSANNDPYGQNAEPNLSNYQDYFSYSFHDGIRANRIQELLKARKQARGILTPADMQAIQLDHKDSMAAHFISLLDKVPELLLSDDAKVLRERLIAWKNSGTQAEVDSKEPAPFYEWLNLLMKDHFSYVSNKKGVSTVAHVDNRLKETWDEAMKAIYISPMAIETLYHQTKDGLASTQSEVIGATLKRVVRTLESAAQNLKKNGTEFVRWGSINRLTFHDAFNGMLPIVFSLPIERPGSWETVDPAAPGMGTAFRMVVSVKKEGPIQAWVSMPGANYDASGPDKTNVIRSILDWRDGKMRGLVDF